MWLNNNPFFILNACMDESTSQLIGKTASTGENSKIRTEALATLRNPRRRIAAELRWPQEAETINRECLRKYIADKRIILPSPEYSPLSNINILMQDLQLYHRENPALTVRTIGKLDELYSHCSPEEITRQINRIRSGVFPEVRLSDVEKELGNLREEMKREIATALDCFCDKEYYRAAREMARSLEDSKCLTPFRNDGIKRYELQCREKTDRLQSEMRELMEQLASIRGHLVASRVDELCRKIRQFGYLAYPMGAKAAAEGQTYDYADDFFREFRNAYVDLYNQRDLYDEAQRMAEALLKAIEFRCDLREKVTEDIKRML